MLPWLLLLAVVLDDALLLPRAPSYLVLGLLDEPAHLATSLVLLLAARPLAARAGVALRPAFALGVLLAGNLIDVDHVPGLLGSDVLTAGTPRPYSHSLALLVPLLMGTVAARGRARPVVGGVALGVAGHLVRDLGTAPVALFWPLSPAGVTIPHAGYLAVLAAAAAVPALAGLLDRAPAAVLNLASSGLLNRARVGADSPGETALLRGRRPEGGADGQVGRDPLPARPARAAHRSPGTGLDPDASRG